MKKISTRKRRTSFTITEILIVVVIISTMAAFAIPIYDRAIRKANERDAIVKVRAFDAIITVYREIHGIHWQPSSGLATSNLDEINLAFGTDFENTSDVTYNYFRVSDDEAYGRMVVKVPGSATTSVLQVESSGVCCYSIGSPCLLDLPICAHQVI